MIRTFMFILFLSIVTHGNTQVNQDTTLESQLDDISITGNKTYDAGVTTLSRKQFLTMAGALEDPTRLLIKSPGISTANDQANSVIYHGLPAQYHQWSLYGARILNPNHNSNAGTISDLPSSSAGGVNMLSGQVIGSLEFNGSPSVKSLGSLAGMSDVKLRNPYKTGLTTNLSLIGLEAGYDIAKGEDNFMINYRYSTVGILTSGLGLDFGGEEINYQDLTSKYSIKRKSGDYSFYLSAGANSNRKDSLESSLVTEFKDLQNSDYTAKIFLGGVNHKYENDKFVISSTINLSRRVVDKLTEANVSFDSTIEYENKGTLLSLKHSLSRKYGKIRLGYGIESWLEQQFLRKLFPSKNTGQFINRSLDRTSLTVLPTINLFYKVTNSLSLSTTAGIHSQQTGSSILNFVGHANLNYSKGNWVGNLSFSRSAQNQSIELVLDEFANINPISNNYSLDVQYKGFGVNVFRHKLDRLPFNRIFSYTQLSLQNLDNLPLYYDSVYGNPDFAAVQGISLFGSYNLLGLNITNNLTLQKSDMFVSPFGINSNNIRIPLDYGFIFNLRLDKEWHLENEKSFGLSASIHTRGGNRQDPVDIEESFNWGYTSFKITGYPSLKLSDYFRADLRIYYKPSKRSTISLDIQNVTNRENDAYYYYEPLTQSSKLKTQLGMIPILSWRVDW